MGIIKTKKKNDAYTVYVLYTKFMSSRVYLLCLLYILLRRRVHASFYYRHTHTHTSKKKNLVEKVEKIGKSIGKSYDISRRSTTPPASGHRRTHDRPTDSSASSWIIYQARRRRCNDPCAWRKCRTTPTRILSQRDIFISDASTRDPAGARWYIPCARSSPGRTRRGVRTNYSTTSAAQKNPGDTRMNYSDAAQNTTSITCKCA